MLDELGLPQPAWRTVAGVDDLTDMPYPYWLKAAFSTAGQGVREVVDERSRARGAGGAAGRGPGDGPAPRGGSIRPGAGSVRPRSTVGTHTSEQRGVGMGGSAAARLSVDHVAAARAHRGARRGAGLARRADARPLRCQHALGLADDALLRALERDVRHAARAHAGARQAGGGARAARAGAAARGAAPDRARLGDAAAAGAGRLRRARGRRSTCARTRRWSSTATGARGASRSRPTGRSARSRASCSARCARSPGRSRSTPRRRRCRGACRSTRTSEHASYDPDQVASYFAAATRAALVLARSARRIADARRR